ncbi:MAG: ribonuclease HII [Candidatus Margulisbacteria bacterium]|nr:ribonuclease HII [Candidatus Margulisiibacteriota bacterium]
MGRPSFLIENKLRKKGFSLIAGVDEVGRGPLAGPIVAAAVIFPPNTKIKGLLDSKSLIAKQRERFYKEIQQKALAIGVAILDHKTIDKINIGKANLLVMKMAVENLCVVPDCLVIDGGRIKLDLPIPQQGLTAGDKKCSSIAAASIIAKVTRDRLMLQLHKKYPKYRFDLHKGYGTEKHLKRLKKYGPCPIHRRSFSPVSQSFSRPTAGREERS